MINELLQLVCQIERCVDAIEKEQNILIVRESIDRVKARIIELTEQLHYERLRACNQHENSAENRSDGANSAPPSIESSKINHCAGV